VVMLLDSPRFRLDEVMAWLERQSSEGGAT
jgi:hypothetical protein